ncbi:DUF736 domain-containing protein [Bradyrhizobium sp. C-145]|uniref:DUF736 domain-containing protein n=1 Tax=Bradyrhizobium sp. C-145 TaxID=574727 RepID=UPI00201B59FE|nr:DUF736 domain-containing protein [Bradyrhizobium sp. C-145]UQR64328.1 DUF736 domain-containing protein [Bradyrhizobium sp. C-145]
MAQIGIFTASETGYVGSIKTLTLNLKAKLVANAETGSDKAPEYRIVAGTVECGAAWKKVARDSDRTYLSCKIDDPSLPGAIYASLVKIDGADEFALIWSRRSGD